MFNPDDYKINEQRYRLTYAALKLLIKLSPLKVNIHNLEEKGRNGSIFLFNHFTRFETFIPQYILYGKEKALCRAIADSGLFDEGNLGDYLRSVGAIPDKLQNMMEYLVDEINAGHKLIIFPEGGMIKDRKVRDCDNRLDIYKREGGLRRKPHTGAAVIAIKNKLLRDLYLLARAENDEAMVKFYQKRFPSNKTLNELDSFAGSAVEIVPANITFYPMRRDENILESYVKKYAGLKSKRVLEEIKIESNMLLKKTDMDVRFGDVIKVSDYLNGKYKFVLKTNYFLDGLHVHPDRLLGKIARHSIKKTLESLIISWIKKRAALIRDDYMTAIYNLTTINLGHLTAHTLYDINKKFPQGTFDICYLRTLLFMGISDLRNVKKLSLHKDLQSRDYINSILLAKDLHLRKILLRFEKAGLIDFQQEGKITLKAKMEEEFPFDVIRIENPMRVLDNEAQSVPVAIESLDRLYKEDSPVTGEKLALILERRARKIFEEDEEKFQGPEYDDINKSDERTKKGGPFFYKTGKPYEERRGLLLIHGFSSSPAEMEILGDHLHEKGFDVYGLRLPGHGTSPADLRERDRKEWLAEVELGIALISHHAPKIFIAGNSMGALLSLMVMSKTCFKVSGFIAIAPAFRIKDKRLPFVTYLDAAQRLLQHFTKLKTEWPYIESRPENPDINYFQVPYHGLYELYQISKEAWDYIELLDVPSLFIHSEREFTADPEATYEAFEKINVSDKTLVKIDDERHVITLDEKLPVFKAVVDFLERLK